MQYEYDYDYEVDLVIDWTVEQFVSDVVKCKKLNRDITRLSDLWMDRLVTAFETVACADHPDCIVAMTTIFKAASKFSPHTRDELLRMDKRHVLLAVQEFEISCALEAARRFMRQHNMMH